MNKIIPFLNTSRLRLGPLTQVNAAFIQELVNTAGWLRFIGDRNVHSPAEAEAYIERILSTANIRYWVVNLESESKAIGVITFIQRDYLTHPDIGFAFLPEYGGQGFAHEAASAVLAHLMETEGHDRIMATTLPDNERSIQLLGKLGFSFEQEMEHAGDLLLVFSFSRL